MVQFRHHSFLKLALCLLAVVVCLSCSFVQEVSAQVPRQSPASNPELYPWASIQLRGILDDKGIEQPSTNLKVGSSVSLLLNFNVDLTAPYSQYDASERNLFKLNLGLSVVFKDTMCWYAYKNEKTYLPLVSPVAQTRGIDLYIKLGGKYTFNDNTIMKFACQMDFYPSSTVLNQPLITGLSAGPDAAMKFIPLFDGDVPLITVSANQISLRRQAFEEDGFNLFDRPAQTQIGLIPIDGTQYPVGIEIDVLYAGKYYVYHHTYEKNITSPFVITDISCPSNPEITLNISWSSSHATVLVYDIQPTDPTNPPDHYSFNCIAYVEALHIFDFSDITTDQLPSDAKFTDYHSMLVGTNINNVKVTLDSNNFPTGRFDLRADNSTYDFDDAITPTFKYATFDIYGLRPNSSVALTTDDLKQTSGYSSMTAETLYAPGSTITRDMYKDLENYTWELVPHDNIPNVFYYQFYYAGSTTPSALPELIALNAHITMDGFGLQGGTATTPDLFSIMQTVTSFANGHFLGGEGRGILSSQVTTGIGTLFPLLFTTSAHITITSQDTFKTWDDTAMDYNNGKDDAKPWVYLPVYNASLPDSLSGDYLDNSPPSLDLNYFQDKGTYYLANSHLWINGKLIKPRVPVLGKTYAEISIPKTFKKKIDGKTFIEPTHRSSIRFEHLNSQGNYQRVTLNTTLYAVEPIYVALSLDGEIFTGQLKSTVLPFHTDYSPTYPGLPDISEVVPVLPQTSNVCPFKYTTVSNPGQIKDGFITVHTQEFYTGGGSSFTLTYFSGTITGTNPVAIMDSIQIKTLSCRFPIIPSRATTNTIRFSFGDQPSFISGSLLLPAIQAPVAAEVGIQPTRPFFIKQINFGNLFIDKLSSSFSTAMFVYKAAEFRVGSYNITCLNPKYTSTTDAYRGKFTVTTNGRSTLLLSFPDDVLDVIHIDALTSPKMTCSSVPLTIDQVQNTEGILLLGSPGTVPTTKPSSLPSTYAMKIQTKLTPGRVSTITFTATLSVPGVMLLEPPYALDTIPDMFCRGTDGQIYSNIQYYQAPNAVATELKNFPEFASFCAVGGSWSTTSSHCETVYTRVLMWDNVGVKYSDISSPKVCSFIAQRHYSSPPSSQLTGRLTFPDSAAIQDKGQLAAYTGSVLFPAIGSLPTVNFISFAVDSNKEVQLIDGTHLDYTPRDTLSFTLYNANIAKNSTPLQIRHVSSLHQTTQNETVSQELYPVCTKTVEGVITTFDPTGEVTDADKKAATFFYITTEIIPEQTEIITLEDGTSGEVVTQPKQYAYNLVFNQALAYHQRIDCTVKVAYSATTVKKPQTAVVTGDLGRGPYTGYIYLPPVTSDYAFAFESDNITINSPTSGVFSFSIKNLGKPANNNVVYIPLSSISMAPSLTGDTVVCQTPTGVKLPTRYSRQTQYTLQIPLPVLSFNQTLVVSCVYRANSLATNIPSTTIIAQIYENDSGQYGLQQATVNYVPSAPAAVRKGIVIQIYSDPKLAISSIGERFATFITKMTDTDASYWSIYSKHVDYLALVAAKASFDRVLANDVLPLRREAYQHRVTSLDDPLTNPSNSDNIISLADITTLFVSVTSDFTDEDFELIKATFNYQRFYWTDISALTLSSLGLLPFNQNAHATDQNLMMTYSTIWPSVCFEKNRCGPGCSQLCLNDEPCSVDFDCVSGYCNNAICQVRDFSIYPPNFFVDYNKK